MITVENAHKYYRINRLKKVVLRNVSFKFQAGRSYGILGINGAGKSTFMRLLSGTELPNGGRIRRTVRVSWPLGFAGGLHPNMTGRDNVSFVARAYGENVRETVEFVEDFAEVGPYMDAPVKTYSSGMVQRVAFGLSMAINFDCYLIDEVMAVGDARFQARCKTEFEKRKKFSDIIMVSHGMDAIQTYCQEGIVLAGGELHHFPKVADAIEAYRLLNM
ncbi:MAG TPA: ABC transporter ATP-binding protein [Xanthobacteraceae bacterium]|nr:ABC transporter ATP-binding protein [Xanthobacteraceae bacterium]